MRGAQVMILIVCLIHWSSALSGLCEKGGKFDCPPNSVCFDTEKSFDCKCVEGFSDIGEGWDKCVAIEGVSTTVQPNICEDKCTDEHEHCVDRGEEYSCECVQGYSRNEESRKCTTTAAPGENFC